MADVCIEAGEAMELGQLLDFLAGWFGRGDPRLAGSYTEFVGHDAAEMALLR
jgi:hypothetical protein